jgi:hypothetical protein
MKKKIISKVHTILTSTKQLLFGNRNAPAPSATNGPTVAKETTSLLSPHPGSTENSGLTAEFVNPVSTPTAVLKCVACIILYLCLAILAFSVIFESWSIADSLYYAVVTFTTIGQVHASLSGNSTSGG